MVRAPTHRPGEIGQARSGPGTSLKERTYPMDLLDLRPETTAELGSASQTGAEAGPGRCPGGREEDHLLWRRTTGRTGRAAVDGGRPYAVDEGRGTQGVPGRNDAPAIVDDGGQRVRVASSDREGRSGRWLKHSVHRRRDHRAPKADWLSILLSNLGRRGETPARSGFSPRIDRRDRRIGVGSAPDEGQRFARRT
jgi:hypothetical protein